MSLIDLPIDVLIEILSKLTNSEIAKFCQTNPHLNAICKDNRLWTCKFIKDFPLLNINEYDHDLYSYINVYKSFIVPLSLIKHLYDESLGTVYLSFLVQEDGMDKFIHDIGQYLTLFSVIVMINSERDPLLIGVNNEEQFVWIKNPKENKIITEVLILDIEDITVMLEQNYKFIIPNWFNPDQFDQDLFGRVIRTIRRHLLLSLVERRSVEKAIADARICGRIK